MEENTDTISALREYVQGFEKIRPSVFDYFEGGSNPLIPLPVESERGAGTLFFFASLYQNITEPVLMRILSELWKEFGTDIFKLNRLPFARLNSKILSLPGTEKWAFAQQAAGVLRSGCDFFYAHGGLLAWVEKEKDAENCVEIMCRDVFLMGKTSVLKWKPRYFMWLLTQLKNISPDFFWNDRALVPITQGHTRIMREFGPLRKGRVPWTTPAEKQDYFNRFYRMLFPGESFRVYLPFDRYLKPGDLNPSDLQFQCLDAVKHCRNCRLVELCPGKVGV